MNLRVNKNLLYKPKKKKKKKGAVTTNGLSTKHIAIKLKCYFGIKKKKLTIMHHIYVTT